MKEAAAGKKQNASAEDAETKQAREQMQMPPPGIPGQSKADDATTAAASCDVAATTTATSDGPDWWDDTDVRLKFQQENPKREGTGAALRYEAYKHATTVGDAKAAGATVQDLKNDKARAYLLVLAIGGGDDGVPLARVELGKPGKRGAGERSPLHDIEENELDGGVAGLKKVKGDDGGGEDSAKARGGTLGAELAAAADDGMHGGAADQTADVGGSRGNVDGAGGGNAHVVAASGTSNNITMTALASMMQETLSLQLGPITMEMKALRGEVGAVRAAFGAELTEIGGRVGRLETTTGETRARLEELDRVVSEIKVGGGGGEDGWSESGSIISMMSKISALEVGLEKLRTGKVQGMVAVVGGLTGYDGEEWKAWLEMKLGQQGGERHVGMYWKGAWSGMMWLKYGTTAGRDNAVKAVKSMGMRGVWAAPDRPLEDRVVGSFMLGLKTLLVDWGMYEKREVRVDMETSPMTMTVGAGKGTLVATARVKDGEAKVQWEDGWWAGWAELQGDEGYKKLGRIARDKLGKTTTKRGDAKGTCKGKSGKSGKGGQW